MKKALLVLFLSLLAGCALGASAQFLVPPPGAYVLAVIGSVPFGLVGGDYARRIYQHEKAS